MNIRKLTVLFISAFVGLSVNASDKKTGSILELSDVVTISGTKVNTLDEVNAKYILVETSSSDSSSFKKDREQYFTDVYNHYKKSGFEWVTKYNSESSALYLVDSDGLIYAVEEDLRKEGLERVLRVLFPKTPVYRTLDVETFDKKVSEMNNLQVVDVRTEDEYNAGTVPGSVLIDMKKKDFSHKADSLLDKSKPVAVFCKGGVRSRKAAWKLVDMGFEVLNLDKGYDSWKKYKGSSVILTARMEIKPDCIDDFKGIAAPLIEATRKEAGCVRYELYQDSSNPCLFFFFEEYKDDAANLYHSKQEYLKEFKAKREPMLKSAPKAIVYKTL